MQEQREPMESPLEAFIRRFQTLSDQERQKKKTRDGGDETIAYNPDLANIINPRTLNETDRALWKKIEDQTITLDEFRQYGNTLRKELDTTDDTETHKTRISFRAYAGNKALPIIGRKETERLRSKEQL